MELGSHWGPENPGGIVAFLHDGDGTGLSFADPEADLWIKRPRRDPFVMEMNLFIFKPFSHEVTEETNLWEVEFFIFDVIFFNFVSGSILMGI